MCDGNSSGETIICYKSLLAPDWSTGIRNSVCRRLTLVRMNLSRRPLVFLGFDLCRRGFIRLFPFGISRSSGHPFISLSLMIERKTKSKKETNMMSPWKGERRPRILGDAPKHIPFSSMGASWILVSSFLYLWIILFLTFFYPFMIHRYTSLS